MEILGVSFDCVRFCFRFDIPHPQTAEPAGKVDLHSLASVSWSVTKAFLVSRGRTGWRPAQPPFTPSYLFWKRVYFELQWVFKTAFRLQTPWVLKEPEFPPSVLFRFSFGFLLGSWGVRLLSVRRRCDLSFLERMKFPQNWLEFVFLLLEI